MFADYQTPERDSDTRKRTESEEQNMQTGSAKLPEVRPPTPRLDTLANQAEFELQKLIDAGSVPGVAAGTPVKSVLRAHGKSLLFMYRKYYLLTFSIDSNLLPQHRPAATPILGAFSERKQSDPPVEGRIVSTSSAAASATTAGSDVTGAPAADDPNPVKEGDHMVKWDPKIWKITSINDRSQYYTYYYSYEYPVRWGVRRVPAIAKHNAPFSRADPLLMYPGRIVYTVNRSGDPPDQYYVFVEGHLHDKKQKRSAQMLLFVPEQCRPSVSDTAPEDVQLGACFQIMNLNYIDVLRTCNADPPAVSWDIYLNIQEFVRVLMELETLPEICFRGVDIMPSGSQRSNKRRNINYGPPPDEVEPVQDDSASGEPSRNKSKSGRPLNKTTPFTPEPIPPGRNNKSSLGSEEEEQPPTAPEGQSGKNPPRPEPPNKKPRTGRGSTGKSGATSDAVKAIEDARGGTSASGGTATVIPTPIELGTILRGTDLLTTVNLSQSDREWISAEIRSHIRGALNEMTTNTLLPQIRTSTESVRALVKGSRETIIDAVKASSADERQQLGTVQNSVSQMQRDVSELLKTPMFTWEQMVNQFDMYNKIARGNSSFGNFGSQPAAAAQGHGYAGSMYSQHAGGYEYNPQQIAAQRPPEGPYGMGSFHPSTVQSAPVAGPFIVHIRVILISCILQHRRALDALFGSDLLRYHREHFLRHRISCRGSPVLFVGWP